nr:cell wall invertase inhibitor protein CWIIP20 [Ipomoea batatas]GLL48481.1 invertase inhibitor-like protein [Ipomoea trifida]UVV38465.1 cell wall invertase inhibitor protein CWIIP20 [Ipomoea batatas]UVV38466.1 cell wall invertase inhibitor protein CWIIP20 [Ipomoea batatas]UVV38473.1 cell wall invertase inhibitor protein CWIIP20 [Ipomoea batatas]
MKSLFTAMMLISSVLNGGKIGNNNYSSDDDDGSSNGGLINTACNNTPNYALCVSVLASDPRTSSKAVNVETLGLVMVDAVKAKAEEMIETIRELEKSKPVEWRLPLSQCYIYYYAVVHADVPEAEAALKRGVPKFAEDGMADAAVEAESCEAAFKLQNDDIILDYSGSAIDEINKDVIQLSAVATSIIKMLL